MRLRIQIDKSINEAENIDQREDNVITIDNIEPCLRKVEETMEKVKLTLEKQALKCDQCEFEAQNILGGSQMQKNLG